MAVRRIIRLLRFKVEFNYPKSVRFRCVKCGLCCGDTKAKTRHIILLKSEADQISKTMLQPISQFATKIEGREPYIYEMRKRENGKCVYLQNNRCNIYKNRPLICRFYPFELSSYGGKYSFQFTEECSGINKGRILRETYFRKIYNLALAKYRRITESSRRI